MDDLISRQAAIDTLNDDFTLHDERDVITVQQYIMRICMRLKNLTSAQPERKKGRWVFIRQEEGGNALYECPFCHKGDIHVPIVKVWYCWNCGAEMMEGEE